MRASSKVQSRWTAAAVFVVSLSTYLFTLAPTVTLEHSGMLVVAADHLGVSRMPGYPVWHLLAHGFTHLGDFARYREHPNPAWSVNFMSAFWGALAVAILARLIVKIVHLQDPARSPLVAPVAAFSGSLLFAFSPLFWRQAVVAETHTLRRVTCSFFAQRCSPPRKSPGQIGIFSAPFSPALASAFHPCSYS